jgi:hypothetical protein
MIRCLTAWLLLATMLFVPLGSRAQDIGDKTESVNLGTEADRQNLPTEANLDDAATRVRTGSALFGAFVGGMVGVALGPVGIVAGGIGGYLLGKKIGEWIDGQSKRDEKVEQKANDPETIKINELKVLLAAPPYNVKARDGDDPDAATMREENELAASRWNGEQLQILKDTLDSLPAEFRQDTKAFYRFKEMDDFAGVVFFNASQTVVLFDKAWDPKADPKVRAKFFQRMIVHEMTHTWQAGSGKAAAEEFRKAFWFVVANPVQVWSKKTFPDSKVTLPTWMYALGVSTTQYATEARWANPDADAGRSYHWGDEDMADSVSMLYSAKSTLKAGFPKRFAFLEKTFGAMTLPAGKTETGNYTSTNVWQLHFLIWSQGLTYLIQHEHSPLTFLTRDGKFDWIFCPKDPAMSDREDIKKELKRVFENGFQPPNDDPVMISGVGGAP